ncbi:MAG: glycine--tRNA ligase subunit beta [Gammaproteobacteria bacterium]|nr:glycine--tRNA ligase subunit beta [Gammaproteobacteria bacterium]
MIKKNLLIEIGTEELPPKALKRLAMSFADEIQLGLAGKNLEHDECKWLATPRRLAVVISDLDSEQKDTEVERRGPAVSAAFGEDGSPSKAAEGFARSCGVSVEELGRLETEKGSWLAYKAIEKGSPSAELLQDIIASALNKLPIPKRMRWGAGDAEFVRPVHWILILFGEQSLPASILGIDAGKCSYGHRFHQPGEIIVLSAADYAKTLEDEGKVIVDYQRRQQIIEEQVVARAKELGGEAIIDPALLEEVTSLVEWPVPVSGNFDESFLELPQEVLIASMQDHQKYFPVKGKDQKLLPHFITVANIDSRTPEEISRGNERVIHPRLSDAAFFWQRDTAKALIENQEGLKNIVYQKQLGSLYDKSERVKALCAYLADELELDKSDLQRAAVLAKCDLSSSLVGEFPELQGVMGRYYASKSGENSEVAVALDEQYMPRFSGDALPSGQLGQALSLAEKTDTLIGIFAIGQAPTGDKDPFGLRRAAIGCLRIMIECELDLDLADCLENSAKQFDSSVSSDQVVADVFDFVMQRLKRYYADNELRGDVFEAVLAVRPTRLLDFHKRVQAVNNFCGLPESASLAAANKRIENILKQNNNNDAIEIDEALLQEPAEQLLASALKEISKTVQPLLSGNDYSSILSKLAELRDPVDNFFDEVMVMSEDEALKSNRLALLRQITTLFLSTADISKLQAQ